MIKSHSFSIGMPPVEAFKYSEKKARVSLDSNQAGGIARHLDVTTWLPQAAPHYKISGDIRDYIIVPVPSIITSVPNTNGDSASLGELTRFLPEHGMMSFRTWVGKPTHVEHDNRDITKAKGVILDTYIRPLPRHPKHAKLVMLLAFDRTKDPYLVNKILTRKVSTYSMGMYYSSYVCPICSLRVGKGYSKPCQHTRPGRPTYQMLDGRLAYRLCENLLGFENSVVEDPAYVSAQSDILMDPTRL